LSRSSFTYPKIWASGLLWRLMSLIFTSYDCFENCTKLKTWWDREGFLIFYCRPSINLRWQSLKQDVGWGKTVCHVLTEMKVFTDEKRGYHLHSALIPSFPICLDQVWHIFILKYFVQKIGNQLIREIRSSVCIIILSKLSPVKMEIHRTEIYIKFSHNVRNLCKFTLFNLNIFHTEVFIPQADRHSALIFFSSIM